MSIHLSLTSATVAAIAVGAAFLMFRRRKAPLPQTLAVLRLIPIAPSINRSYSHGGHMGVAAQFLDALDSNPRWAERLREATPSVARRVAACRGSAAAMRVLENSPVVAAFAVARGAAERECTIEWDVYIPVDVDSALATTTTSLPSELLERILASTVVAHGTLWRSLLERFGISAYPALLAASDSMSIAEWVSVFRRITSEEGATTGSLFSVFLDIKSRHTSPACLVALVRAINSLGIVVWGVGSFSHTQLARIAQLEQQIVARHDDDERHPAPIAFCIITFVSDVQAGCESGSLLPGAHILFNGGTLISHDTSASSVEALQASYRIDPALLTALSAYQRAYTLKLGWYAQEYALDATAADLLVRTANEHPDLFAYGFNYSGASGFAPADIVPTSVADPATGIPIPSWLRPLFSRAWDFSRSAKR